MSPSHQPKRPSGPNGSRPIPSSTAAVSASTERSAAITQRTPPDGRRTAAIVPPPARPAAALPVVALNVARTRQIVVSFLVLTSVNLLVLGFATHKSVEVMDSTRFCGTTCHTIMEPEYAGHQGSAHAGVRCVACHIG